jgi:hypothetical protein
MRYLLHLKRTESAVYNACFKIIEIYFFPTECNCVFLIKRLYEFLWKIVQTYIFLQNVIVYFLLLKDWYKVFWFSKDDTGAEKMSLRLLYLYNISSAQKFVEPVVNC